MLLGGGGSWGPNLVCKSTNIRGQEDIITKQTYVQGKINDQCFIYGQLSEFV